jgi:hypothetical protein
LAGKFFLYGILPQALSQGREDHMVKILILIEAGENNRFFTCFRIPVELQALSANFLHHTLHGGIDGANGYVRRVQMLFQETMTGFCNSFHHHI